MNPNTIHYSAEVGVALLIVMYFQFKVSGLRGDFDKFKDEYETDKAETRHAINNLNEGLKQMNGMLNHIMQSQGQQYALPPAARAPPAPGPQPSPGHQPYGGGPPAQQQRPGRAAAARPPNSPPRGSREDLRGAMSSGGPALPPNVQQVRSNIRQGVSGSGGRPMPGMPQDVQAPPPMEGGGGGGNYDRDEEGGGAGAYGTIGFDDDDYSGMTAGKKGGLKSMAAQIEQSRRATMAVSNEQAQGQF